MIWLIIGIIIFILYPPYVDSSQCYGAPYVENLIAWVKSLGMSIVVLASVCFMLFGAMTMIGVD
jgi:hypothetical protein